MDKKIFNKRIVLTGLLMMSIACFFVYKLFNLHFSDRIKISRNKEIEVRRGYIKDRHGYIIGMSIEMDSLFANPEEIKNPDRAARILSPVIGISKNFIKRRLKK